MKMLDFGGPRPKSRVVGLLDSDGQVRHVEAVSDKREAPWRRVWKYRHKLVGKLAEWLQSLPRAPKEIVLLGNGARLTGPTAKSVVRVLSTWFPVVDPPAGHWRYGTPLSNRASRPVCRVARNGKLTIWPTHGACAKSLGISVMAVGRWIDSGRLLPL